MHISGKVLLILGVLGLILTAVLWFMGTSAVEQGVEGVQSFNESEAFWKGSAADTPTPLNFTTTGSILYQVFQKKGASKPASITLIDSAGTNHYTPQTAEAPEGASHVQIGHFAIPTDGSSSTYTLTIVGGDEVFIKDPTAQLVGIMGGLLGAGSAMCTGACSAFLLLLGLILGLALKKKAEGPQQG